MNVLMVFCMLVKKNPKDKDNGIEKKRRFSYFFIPLSSVFIFSLGFIPLVSYIFIVKEFFWFDTLWMYVFLPFLIYFGISILLLSQLFISGILVKLLRLYYVPGTFSYDTKDKNALKWMIIVSVYTPIRKMLEIIPMGRLKNTYLRLVGMKIGKNTLVGGVIKDPCVTKIGNHCTMGEYAIIYGHVHDFEHATILIDPVTIGDNCVIGAGAIIMPGAVIEDNVKVAAGALVTKRQRLSSGNIYVGIPARKL